MSLKSATGNTPRQHWDGAKVSPGARLVHCRLSQRSVSPPQPPVDHPRRGLTGGSWLSLPQGPLMWPEPLLLLKKEAVFLASDPCRTWCGCSGQRLAGRKGLRRVVGRAGGHWDSAQACCCAPSLRDDCVAGLSQGRCLQLSECLC